MPKHWGAVEAPSPIQSTELTVTQNWVAYVADAEGKSVLGSGSWNDCQRALFDDLQFATTEDQIRQIKPVFDAIRQAAPDQEFSYRWLRNQYPNGYKEYLTWGITGARTASAGDWKSKYNYREAKGSKSCATCSAFKNGKCEMFDAPAEADMTCDEWSDTWKKTAAGAEGDVMQLTWDDLSPEHRAYLTGENESGSVYASPDDTSIPDIRTPAMHYPDENLLVMGQPGWTHGDIDQVLKDKGIGRAAWGIEHAYHAGDPSLDLEPRWNVQEDSTFNRYFEPDADDIAEGTSLVPQRDEYMKQVMPLLQQARPAPLYRGIHKITKTAGDVHDQGDEWVGNLSFLLLPDGTVQMGAPGDHHPQVFHDTSREPVLWDPAEGVPPRDSLYWQTTQGNVGFAVDKRTGEITFDMQDFNGNAEIEAAARQAVEEWIADGAPTFYGREDWREGSVDKTPDTWFNKESNDDQTWQEDGRAGSEAQEAAGAPAGQVEYYWPSAEEAQELSYHAVDNHQGFRDPGGFASAVGNARYQQIYGGVSDPYTLAAHLINYVQRQQALVEGNKRTATLLGLWFLEENGVPTDNLPQEEFGDLIVSMAEKTVTPEQVGEYLRQWLSTRTSMAVSPDILQQHIDRHGPLLWHGTSIKNVPSILQHGILPHDQLPSDADAYPWSNTSAPMPNAVYMRHQLNPQQYYEKEDEVSSALFGIDLTQLDPNNIIMDEDNLPDRWNDETRRRLEQGEGMGAIVRDTIPDQVADVDSWLPWNSEWAAGGNPWSNFSLAHDGPIPPEAIAGLYHQQQWYDPEDYQHDFLGYDPDLGFETYAKFVLKGDWNDVMAKAKRLIQEGKVTVLHNTPQHVMAQVMGDGSDNDGEPDMHEVEFSRDDPNSNVITQSVCDCAYNQYRWDRTRPWKKYEGRPCSHILAAYWKSKSTPQDIEDAQPGYQVPVGQKGPAAPPGQMKIPGAEPGVTKQDLGFGSGAFGPEGQEGGAAVPPPVPSTQQIGIPGQPQNPFAPPKSTPGAPPKNPTPQREQLELFNLSPEPSTTPPNPAVSVPGATPPTPENPVQLPGTFSRVRLSSADDEMLQHFLAQQADGEPIYASLTKPQTLEYRGGKHPMPGAQPYDVSSEGVPLYRPLELGYNPETGQRENADVNALSGAPEWRGQFGDVPVNRRGEVRDFDPHLGWAYMHVPLHYPGGEDARLHPHSLAGWVPMNELQVVHPPRTPFRRRR